METTLAPPRGTIEFKMPEYQGRTKFFNMYDTLGSLAEFQPVEVVGYPTHTVELVKAEGEDGWKTAAADDELVMVVHGEVGATFRDNGRRVASATAVKGEILLLPRGLEYQLSGPGPDPGLFLHFRTKGGS